MVENKIKLPEAVMVEGVEYKLNIEKIAGSEQFEGWTCCSYINKNSDCIYPSIKVNGFIEYLVSMYEKEEDALEDMNRKVSEGDLSKNFALLGLGKK